MLVLWIVIAWLAISISSLILKEDDLLAVFSLIISGVAFLFVFGFFIASYVDNKINFEIIQKNPSQHESIIIQHRTMSDDIFVGCYWSKKIANIHLPSDKKEIE